MLIPFVVAYWAPVLLWRALRWSVRWLRSNWKHVLKTLVEHLLFELVKKSISWYFGLRE
jgi:hypothetical protein